MGDLGLSFRDNFLAFSLSCPDAMDPSSLISRIGDILTLKVFLNGLQNSYTFNFIFIVWQSEVFGVNHQLLHIEVILDDF